MQWGEIHPPLPDSKIFERLMVGLFVRRLTGGRDVGIKIGQWGALGERAPGYAGDRDSKGRGLWGRCDERGLTDREREMTPRDDDPIGKKTV